MRRWDGFAPLGPPLLPWENRMERGQTDTWTDFATTRKNRPKGRFFEKPLVPSHKSQVAEIFREFTPPTTCHVSCVKCHMSHITYHMSHVFFCGGTSRLRVCYQRGLPLLVNNVEQFKIILFSLKFRTFMKALNICAMSLNSLQHVSCLYYAKLCCHT